MKTLLAFLVVIVLISAEDFVCKNGESYMENNCNNCFCTNGNLGCTMKLCESGLTKQMAKCKIGTETVNACNYCWCVEKIGTVCTKKQC